MTPDSSPIASDLFTHTKREGDFAIVPGVRSYERYEVTFPYRNRDNENANRAIQIALCQDPVFLIQIQNLRSHLLRIEPPSDQPFGTWLKSVADHNPEMYSELREHAKHICEYWGIDAWVWITWLARDWDPVKDETPPLEPGEALAFVAPWAIDSVSHKLHCDNAPWQIKYVLLTLRPGISRSQAERALREAFKMLPTAKESGRPSVSERERDVLHNLFAKLDAKTSKRQNTIHQAIRALKGLYGKEGMLLVPGSLQNIKEPTVAKEYDNWKRNQRREAKPKRRYTTRKTDRRNHSARSAQL